MFIATVVVACLLAVGLIGSGRAKLMKNPTIMQNMAKVGVPENNVWLLAVAEIAGAIGLLLGLFWGSIGVAAAIGVILYFLGALGAHLRVRDKDVVPATVFLLVAVAALALRTVTI